MSRKTGTAIEISSVKKRDMLKSFRFRNAGNGISRGSPPDGIDNVRRGRSLDGEPHLCNRGTQVGCENRAARAFEQRLRDRRGAVETKEVFHFIYVRSVA
ncbi:MAG: hypothetical protein CVU57_19430 [Deltaproteobacteria bacterium HGW-Deltaproteobacteria-15]|nr:MAG: hypothetical protein CVU57_19430 [Deltaproteobacteria bacterium HGW-Deltaproteobacteria-15]